MSVCELCGEFYDGEACPCQATGETQPETVVVEAPPAIVAVKPDFEKPRHHNDKVGDQGWEDIIEMVQKNEEGKRDLYVPLADLRMDDDGFIGESKDGLFQPTDWALGQIASFAGAPGRYMKDIPAWLRAQCINHGLEAAAKEASDKRMFLRTRGDALRAMLSERYTELDDLPVVQTLADIVNGSNGFNNQVRSFKQNERGMWFKLLVNDLRAWDPVHKDTELKVGFIIGNSEVGGRSLSVSPFVYRCACTNDLVVMDDSVLRQRHVHLRPHELRGRMVEAVTAQLESGAELMDRFVSSHAEQVESPREVLNAILLKRKASKKLTAQVVDAYNLEPVNTKFGLINAMTKAAQELGTDERVELERMAGQVLNQRALPAPVEIAA